MMDLVYNLPRLAWGESPVGRGQAPIGPESRDACDLNHVVSASRKAPAPQSVRAIVGCQPWPDLPGPALGPNGPGRSVTVPWWAL